MKSRTREIKRERGKSLTFFRNPSRLHTEAQIASTKAIIDMLMCLLLCACYNAMQIRTRCCCSTASFSPPLFPPDIHNN